MPLQPEDVLRLYDEHAPRLFALALRITGGDRNAAAAVLEEVFAGVESPDIGALVRATRERALTRQSRSPLPTVGSSGSKPSARQLVEEAFYRGMTAATLAAAYGLDEEAVRSLLRDGMEELREQFRPVVRR